jgi:hypothetical protein
MRARFRARDADLPESDRTERRLHHRVYVVRLDHPRAHGRDAFYVGMTGLPLEERFANHKRGDKASRVVQRYGVELAWELFDGIPAMSFEEAALTEPTLADDLRDLGHLVFGPTNRRPTMPPAKKRRTGSKKRRRPAASPP